MIVDNGEVVAAGVDAAAAAAGWSDGGRRDASVVRLAAGGGLMSRVVADATACASEKDEGLC